MKTSSLLLILFAFLMAPAHAVSPSEIPTDVYRHLITKLVSTETTLPTFDVCLRHPDSGECLNDRPKFFSCNSQDIALYISCITDPTLNRKISAAYEKMYISAKAEIEKIRSNQTLAQAQKTALLAKMAAAISEYERFGTDERQKLKQIDQTLEEAKRFEVAGLLRSESFLHKLKAYCQAAPLHCPSMPEYVEAIKKRLNRLKAQSLKIKSETGVSLQETLATELDLIRRCQKEQSTFCKETGPDEDVLQSVSEEINAGLCKLMSFPQRLSKKDNALLRLICIDYYHYLKSREESSEKKSEGKGLLEQRPAITDGSKNGLASSKTNGTYKEDEGIYLDVFAKDLKEDTYNCKKHDSTVHAEKCDDDTSGVLGTDVIDLAKTTSDLSSICGEKLDPKHAPLMDAASYMLETQFRAYVDRLNLDRALTSQQFQKQLERIINSCTPPKKNESKACDYSALLSEKTSAYLKSLAAQAALEHEKIKVKIDLQKAYLNDVTKAASDVKAIDSTLKDLLANFPSPKGSLHAIWPDAFPCQTMVDQLDDIKKMWENNNYNTRCAPLEAAEQEKIWPHEEKLYQELHAAELGLIEGKRLKDYPPDQLARYRSMKKDPKFNSFFSKKEDLIRLKKDKKFSPMFEGTMTPAGRVIVAPVSLTGLESRAFECQKKALQVKRLITMKMSLLSNYPQLANKTFADGQRPSKEWTYWDRECRGKNRLVTECPGDVPCRTSVKIGCEKVPADWNRQSEVRPLYEQLGSDPSTYEAAISRQLTVDGASPELDSLLKSTREICEDPLKAGEDIVKDDKLYTLYATCSLQNIQNGQRRFEGDEDEYQFWKGMNQSAASRALCARRAAGSSERCHLMQDLNSGVLSTLEKSAKKAAVPLVKTLDFVGCAALMTGIGGALNQGIRSGVRAGIDHLYKDAILAGSSLATKTGAAMTVGGLGLTSYYENDAKSNLDRKIALHASGMTTIDEVEAARKHYDEMKLANNLQTVLIGALLPAGEIHVPNHGAPVAHKLAPIKNLSEATPQIHTDVTPIVLPEGRVTQLDNRPVSARLVEPEELTPVIVQPVTEKKVLSVEAPNTVKRIPEDLKTSVSGPRGRKGKKEKSQVTQTPYQDKATFATIPPKADRPLPIQAKLGRCCSGAYKKDLPLIEKAFPLSLNKTQGENPYFTGQVRRADKQRLMADEHVSGYQFNVPKSELSIDLNKSYPGLNEINLPVFKLDATGKLTPEAQTQAIDYIRENLPDSKDLDISFQAQGGLNAVFKVCPKAANAQCEAIKLSVFDKVHVDALRDARVKLDDIEFRISELGLQSDNQELAQLRLLRDKAQEEVAKATHRVTSGIENFKHELMLSQWADELTAPGVGPTLDGKEFIKHASVGQDVTLLSKGLMRQKYYTLGDSKSVERLKLTMLMDKGGNGADRAIVSKYSNPKGIRPDVRTLTEFIDLCGKAKLLSVKRYCTEVRRMNNIPDDAQWDQMVKAAMKFYEDTHYLVSRAYSTHTGGVRKNVVDVTDGKVNDGYVRGGKNKMRAIGLDWLYGTNVFLDAATGKLMMIDR